MRPLYHCKSCGMLSTAGASYKHVSGVLFCTHCVAEHAASRQPVAGWVADAIASQPHTEDGREDA